MPNRLRELILLRHAKSDWRDESLADIDRPLSERGRKNAVKVGKWLHHNNLMPDYIMASPARRVQQTLKRLCAECSTEAHYLDELYLADLNTLQQLLAEAPDVKRLMIIGHNPGLERLFNFLDSHSESESHLFPTASLAHFVLPDDWQQLQSGDGRLIQFMRPKDMLME